MSSFLLCLTIFAVFEGMLLLSIFVVCCYFTFYSLKSWCAFPHRSQLPMRLQSMRLKPRQMKSRCFSFNSSSTIYKASTMVSQQRETILSLT